MDEFRNLMECLSEKRYYISDTLISDELALALQDEALTRFEVGDYRKAKVGRNITERLDQRVRGDITSWLDNDINNQSSAQQEYRKFLDQLTQTLNPTFYLGIRSFEGHFACYDEGAFYKKHVDQHRGRGLRRLSVILYLNDLEEGQGGELVLYNFENHDLIMDTIRPKLGRIAIFLSDDLAHEVLPSFAPRISLTGWLRA